MTSKKVVLAFAKTKTMSHSQIADLLDNRNDVVKRTMERLQEKGVILVTPMVVRVRGKETTEYHVNERDSYIVVAQLSPEFTAVIIDQWQELKDRVNQLEQEKINRASASLNYVEQNKILHDTRKAEGKETEPYHYSNEANLINRIVLGCTAKAYRIANDFDKTVNLRDTLSIVELECVASLESTNKELIKIGMEYTDRKEMLLKVFKRDLASKLIDEQMRLEA